MTALTCHYETRRPPSLLLGLILVLMVTGAAVVGLAISHGEIKHGSEAVQVRQCLNDQGHLQLWNMADWEHKARLCDLGNGRIGIQIVKMIAGKWEEITAYTRPGTLVTVGRYLAEIGYVLEWTK